MTLKLGRDSWTHRENDHTNQVVRIAYSPNGTKVVTCSYFELVLRDSYALSPSGGKFAVRSRGCCFSNDSKILVLTVPNNKAGLMFREVDGCQSSSSSSSPPPPPSSYSHYKQQQEDEENASSRQQEPYSRILCSSCVTSIAWCPTRKEITVATDDNKVKIYNLHSQQCRVSFVLDEAAATVSYHPDGKSIVCADGAGVISIYNAISGECRQHLVGFNLQQHQQQQQQQNSNNSFSAHNHNSSFSSSLNNSSFSTSLQQIKPNLLERKVWQAEFSSDPEGTYLVSACRDGTAKVFIKTEKKVEKKKKKRESKKQNNNKSEEAHDDYQELQDDLKEKEKEEEEEEEEEVIITEYKFKRQHDMISEVFCCAATRELYCFGCNNGFLRLFCLMDGRPIANFQHNQAVQSVAFDPDVRNSKKIAVGCDTTGGASSRKATVALWNYSEIWSSKWNTRRVVFLLRIKGKPKYAEPDGCFSSWAILQHTALFLRLPWD